MAESYSVNDLVALIQQGGHDDLIAKLWDAVHRLVASFARDYTLRINCARYGCEADDLIQCGYFAVLDALKHYDPQKGAFSTFLYHYCRHAFQECTGRTTRSRRDALNCAVSLDEQLDDDDPDGGSRYDLIPDSHDYISAYDDLLYTQQLHNALEQALSELCASEADTLRRAYFRGQQITEIAEQTGADYKEVRSLHDRAMRHIRKSKSRQDLERFINAETPFYSFGTLKHFQDTGMSGPERITIIREDLRNRMEKGR